MNMPIEEWMKRVKQLSYRERRYLLHRKLPKPYPHFLYKFQSVDPGETMSINYLRDIIIESKLWLSSPNDFNDPFDSSAKITAEGSKSEKRDRFKAIARQMRHHTSTAIFSQTTLRYVRPTVYILAV